MGRFATLFLTIMITLAFATASFGQGRRAADTAIADLLSAAAKDPSIIPSFFEEVELSGQKSVIFQFRPKLTGSAEREFFKKGDSLSLIHGRMAEFIALKCGEKTFSKREQELFGDLQKDCMSMFNEQLDVATERWNSEEEYEEARIKIAVADGRVRRLLRDFALVYAENRKRTVVARPLYGEFQVELTFGTDPVGGKIYYLNKLDKVYYDSKGYADSPDVWKLVWRAAPAKKMLPCGLYYFRVEWDDKRFHKSAVHEITEKYVLAPFSPDK